MNNNHIKEHIIIPALQAIKSYSDDRLDMVFVTGATESLYQHVRQIGGPARGWFQMEQATHDDIWTNFLGQSDKKHLVDGLAWLTKRPGVPYELEVNPWYAAAMCAIHYMRFEEPLPKAGNRMAQAVYWKRYYNSSKGKGTVGDFLERATEVSIS